MEKWEYANLFSHQLRPVNKFTDRLQAWRDIYHIEGTINYDFINLAVPKGINNSVFFLLDVLGSEGWEVYHLNSTSYELKRRISE